LYGYNVMYENEVPVQECSSSYCNWCGRNLKGGWGYRVSGSGYIFMFEHKEDAFWFSLCT